VDDARGAAGGAGADDGGGFGVVDEFVMS